MVRLMDQCLADGSQMRINDTKRALKEMLANKVIRLSIRAMQQFGEGNPYHDEKGRFTDGPSGGGQSDSEGPSAAPGWMTTDQKKQHDSLETQAERNNYVSSIQQANRSAGSGKGQQRTGPGQQRSGNVKTPTKTSTPSASSGSGNVRIYSGPAPVIGQPHPVAKLSQEDIDAIKNPVTARGKPRPDATEYAGLAAFVKGPGGGWIPPFPHAAYKSAVAGITNLLYKTEANGKTALENLISDHKTIEYYDPHQAGKGNPTYVYDGREIGIPFPIGVSIDTNRQTNGGVAARVTSVFPRKVTLEDARSRLDKAGVDTGIEIVDLKTAAGRTRMAKLSGEGGRK